MKKGIFIGVLIGLLLALFMVPTGIIAADTHCDLVVTFADGSTARMPADDDGGWAAWGITAKEADCTFVEPPGVGDFCCAFPGFGCPDGTKCVDHNCVPEGAFLERDDPVLGNECKHKEGTQDYCFACGPCEEGEGGCNRTWQCKKGLECDLSAHKCVKK